MKPLTDWTAKERSCEQGQMQLIIEATHTLDSQDSHHEQVQMQLTTKALTSWTAREQAL